MRITASRMGCLLHALSRAYDGLGRGRAAGGDECFSKERRLEPHYRPGPCAPGGHDMRFRHTGRVADMEIIPETAPAPASGAPRWRRFLTPWRSPADQPAWARPALLAIAAVAAVAYGWAMAGASVEPFYGAAARSMSEAGTTSSSGPSIQPGPSPSTVPGALRVQALSLRIFGFHIWALVLPQVVEGVLTILVLYRAVRGLAGPAADLIAAAVLAVTPITVLLSRGNVSDSLLILLLVLAADAASAALLTGSLCNCCSPASGSAWRSRRR